MRNRRTQTHPVHVGLAIRTLRAQLGLTTRELGRRANLSHMAIVRQEDTPYPIMRADSLAAVANILGQSVDQILLRGVIGPSPRFTDQLRFNVTNQLLDMDDDELNQMWAAASDVRARRSEAPSPMQQPSQKAARRRGA